MKQLLTPESTRRDTGRELCSHSNVRGDEGVQEKIALTSTPACTCVCTLLAEVVRLSAAQERLGSDPPMSLQRSEPGSTYLHRFTPDRVVGR